MDGTGHKTVGYPLQSGMESLSPALGSAGCCARPCEGWQGTTGGQVMGNVGCRSVCQSVCGALEGRQGVPGHADPRASTCIPAAMGSLRYLLERKVCALSRWHHGAGSVGTHVGAREALLAKEKPPLGYFYFSIGYVCVFTSSAVSFTSQF